MNLTQEPHHHRSDAIRQNEDEKAFKKPKQSPNFDLLGWTGIMMHQKGNEPHKWGANLLFCRYNKSEPYRWYEVSFMMHREDPDYNVHGRPFFLDDASEIDYAMHIDGEIRPVSKLIPIDGEDMDDFIQRWITLFGYAMTGELKENAPF